MEESGTTAQNRTLTRAEKAVLGVLVNPDFFDKTNAEKIEAADVSPRRFYEIMADPWFREQERAAFYDFIRQHVGPILKASIDTAKQAERDGFNDRKMLLEMGGLYVPKSAIDHTTGGKPIKAFADIDDGNDAAKPDTAAPAPGE